MEPQKVSFNKKIQFIIVAFLLVTIFGSGFYVGKNSVSVTSVASVFGGSVSDTADLQAFWKVWQMIDEKSPDAKNVSSENRVYGAISGLASSLGDPYTVFFPPAESKAFQDQIQGSFSGVGMELGMDKNNMLSVIAPLKDTPAYKAGLKTGDIIVKINGSKTDGMSIDQAISLIRGKEGTTVTIQIYRESEKKPRDVVLTRAIINVPVLETEIRKDGIFVIHLYSFTADSDVRFQKAMQKFVESGSHKLIIDLRGNPGGYLDTAISMASYFLPSSAVVVSEHFGESKPDQVYYSQGYNIFDKSLKTVILINGGSASASEILAGALKENGVATLVGETSFGKGSVQELIPVTNDTSLKITVAKWLTPKGNSISKVGITPDFVVKPDTKNPKNDVQLKKAVEILNKK
ncbi:MAG: S41 family peptidase [Minisyncoccia bacterium]